jgi:hypothetical protein
MLCTPQPAELKTCQGLCPHHKHKPLLLICQATPLLCLPLPLHLALSFDWLVQVLLAEVRRLLLVRAKERFSRRILSWPYGGATAEVR